MNPDDSEFSKMAVNQRGLVVENGSFEGSKHLTKNPLTIDNSCKENIKCATSTSVTLSEFPIIQPTLDHSYVYSEKSFTNLNQHRREIDCSNDEDSTDNRLEKMVDQTANNSRESEENSSFLCSKESDQVPGEKVEYDLVSCDQKLMIPLSVADQIKIPPPSQCEGLSANVLSTAECHAVVTSDNCVIASSKPSSADVPKPEVARSPHAPLGSVQNPIQIIQQGNAFRSTQVLSKNQLQQIAQVLQQQQLSKAIQNGGKSVLYDETTNTRIIYRVIYPSELQKKTSSADDSPSPTTPPVRGKGRPRKVWSKRMVDDEKNKLMLSKEEREEKKKHRPRTRSGRISKPPSYMVKDYKRIHHLDFNEEPYDDSDGGYSDYHVSDEENSNSVKKGASDGASSSKQRNYRCPACSKAYIGKGGLSRHYRLNPSHGSMHDGEDVSTQDENSNSSAVSVLSTSRAPPVQATTNVPGGINRPITSTSLPLQTATSVLDFVSSRRRNKLKEILKNFSDEELIDLTMPRLSHVISPWDFMLMCSRDDSTHQLSIADLFKHFESALMEAQKIARNVLSSTALANDSGKKVVHVTNEEIAKALNINPGTYFVKDLKAYQMNNLLLSSLKRNVSNTNTERPLLISPEDMITPPVKQRKVNIMQAPIMGGTMSSDLPAQILSDERESSNSMELNLPSVGFDEGTALHQQMPTQLLSAIQASPATNLSDLSQVVFDCNGTAMPNSVQKTIHVSSHSTTVTPSSLSSGCLPAIDSSEVLQNTTFISAGGGAPAALQTVQMSEVPIFSSTLQNFQTVSPANPLQDFVSNGGLKITGGTNPRQPVIMSEPERALLVMNNVENSNQLRDISSQSSPNVYATVDYVAQPTVSLFDSSTSRSTLPEQLADSDQKSYVQQQAAEMQRALVADSVANESIVSNSEHLTVKNPAESFKVAENYNAVNMASLDVQASEVMDSSSVIRQLVLPDGRVIGTWSPPENQTSSISYGEQFASEQLLPGDLILVQNQDGSYQVPSDQIVSPEALQALLSAGQILISQDSEKAQKLPLI